MRLELNRLISVFLVRPLCDDPASDCVCDEDVPGCVGCSYVFPHHIFLCDGCASACALSSASLFVSVRVPQTDRSPAGADWRLQKSTGMLPPIKALKIHLFNPSALCIFRNCLYMNKNIYFRFLSVFLCITLA